MDKQKLEEARQLAMSMTSHPVAFGTIEHTERAGELLAEMVKANEVLAREAHTWWTAARDAAKAERARCAARRLNMADGNITVEVSTQAAQAELERLRAENAALKREAYTWWQLAASAPRDERMRCAALCKAQADRWADDRARYAAIECAKAIEAQVPT